MADPNALIENSTDDSGDEWDVGVDEISKQLARITSTDMTRDFMNFQEDAEEEDLTMEEEEKTNAGNAMQGRRWARKCDEGMWGDYEGDMKGKTKRNGYGTMLYDNSDSYVGFWVDDKKEGQGTYRSANGAVSFEGGWKADKLEGHGKMVWENGEVYDGEWRNDQRHGCGKHCYVSGAEYNSDSYVGIWADDMRNGQGTFRSANGAMSYEGGWNAGKREGQGKMAWENGEVYHGEWRNDQREGYGKHRYVSGAEYEGLWKGDKRHGCGRQKWKDGEVDVSHYRNDKQVGEGIRWRSDRSGARRLINGRVPKRKGREVPRQEAESIEANILAGMGVIEN